MVDAVGSLVERKGSVVAKKMFVFEIIVCLILCCAHDYVVGMEVKLDDGLATLPPEILIMRVAPLLSYDAFSCLARVDKYRYRLLVPELHKRSELEREKYRLHRKGKLAEGEREHVAEMLWPLVRPIAIAEGKEPAKKCCFFSSQPMSCQVYGVLKDDRALMMFDKLIIKLSALEKHDLVVKDGVWQAYLARFYKEIRAKRAQIAAVASLEEPMALAHDEGLLSWLLLR